MKRALLVVILTSMAWAGCALVIDLGDEATLEPIEAGAPDVVVVIADAGIDQDAAPVFKCGLQSSSNERCAACTETSCCDEGKACAADPACAAGLECVKDCMAQIGCITKCLGNKALGNLTNCSSNKCSQCTPNPKCELLGFCATKLADAGGDGILRNVARGLILDLNEDACEQERKTLCTDHPELPTCSTEGGT